jgi:ActR/RegA family two-component response regulator
MDSIPEHVPPSPLARGNVVMNRLLRESLRQLRAERAAEEAARTPKKRGPKPGHRPEQWCDQAAWDAALKRVKEICPTKRGRISAMARELSYHERTIRRHVNERGYPID